VLNLSAPAQFVKEKYGEENTQGRINSLNDALHYMNGTQHTRRLSWSFVILGRPRTLRNKSNLALRPSK